MTLDLQQIAYDWVCAQLVAEARQTQLNNAFQAINPDNQVFDLDVTNSYYTNLVRTLVGPQAWDWICWWCWECDFGRSNSQFSIDHQWYNTGDMTFFKFWELTCE